MGNVIAIVNNKGGVGKTTLTTNLGHALTLAGKSVCVVDLDSQCNVSAALLGRAEPENSVYELYSEEGISAADCIMPSQYENLDILPAVPECAALEIDLLQKQNKGFSLLRDSLRDHAVENYDFTLIDCPPSLGLFSVQALACSDKVILPLECGSRFSVEGLGRTIDAILSVRDSLNPNLKDIRLLINRLDRRTTISKLTNLQVRKQFGERVFDTFIPVNVSIQQAEMAGQAVTDYAPSSNGAFHFNRLAAELLGSC